MSDSNTIQHVQHVESVGDCTAIPLRKKYYNGEQVIKAVSEHITDYKTLMSIFNSLAEMDGAYLDDTDAYNRGFYEGSMYSLESVEKHIDDCLRRKAK